MSNNQHRRFLITGAGDPLQKMRETMHEYEQAQIEKLKQQQTEIIKQQQAQLSQKQSKAQQKKETAA